MVFAGFGCSLRDLETSAQIIYQYIGNGPVLNHGYSVNMTCKHGYLLNNKAFLINNCTQRTNGDWFFKPVECRGMCNLFINLSPTHSLKTNMAFTMVGHVFSCHLCIFYF